MTPCSFTRFSTFVDQFCDKGYAYIKKGYYIFFAARDFGLGSV